MRDELPPQKVGGAIALMSATLGVGGSVGLLLSALVAQNLNWHFLFWGAAAIGVLAGCLVIAFVPESTMRHPARFDLIGALGLSAGLICLLLPVTKGAQWGWTSPLVLGLLGAALAILLLWGVFEIRIKDPMVDLRVSASKAVLLTNIASVLSGFAMYGINLAMPQLLQAPTVTGYGFGLSMIMAGLCIAPGGLVMMAMSPVSARTSRRYGPKVTLITGLVVLCMGYLLALAAMGAVWQLILVSAVVSTGIALAFGAMPALIMSAAPPDETAAANGLNALMRFLGSSLSSAVVAAVLANDVVHYGPLALPSKQAFQWVFVVGAVAAAIAAAVASLIPHRRAAVAAQAKLHAHTMERAS
jgi:MFS family permease